MIRTGRWPDNGVFTLMNITWVIVTIVAAIHFSITRRKMTRVTLMVPAILGLASCYLVYVVAFMLFLLVH
jgi:hypothetical protein